ncbi:unnamed protein product [Clonostachys rosea]|uniref:Heterokaryon incompatibility domain-containing protein n=1 Tax=Bionectria ochroleuca TaxID=29856 RepID=A0ABY6U9E8_BIOOC|nr:unnamed protein product [Clonostachys rosea]
MRVARGTTANSVPLHYALDLPFDLHLFNLWFPVSFQLFLFLSSSTIPLQDLIFFYTLLLSQALQSKYIKNLIMLCSICREGLEGIWDPSKTKRLCRITEFNENFKKDDAMSRACPPSGTAPDQHPSQYMLGHHLTLKSYMQSVAQGCIFCSHEGQEIAQHSAISKMGYYSLFTINLNKALDPRMEIFKPGIRIGFQSLTVIDASLQDCNLDISPSTGDTKTWALIQGWVDTCIQNHKRCNQASRPSFIPNYLLQLDQVKGLFHLVPSVQLALQSDIRYCTLSHCHRIESQSLQLSKATLEFLSCPQPLSILPLAYIDAFTVVARLGLSYLWIDCLCVLQDGIEPLSSVQIQDIFSNSFCGIGDLASTSPSSGLFTQRKPECITPTVFEFTLNADGDKTLVRSETDTKKFVDEPLIQTAKGFQERLLTPRMIHFGSSFVYWECHGSICDEIYPYGIFCGPFSYTGVEGQKPVTISSKYMAAYPARVPPRPAWKPLLTSRLFHHLVGDVKVDTLNRWWQLLEAYTKCTLSAPGQRLTCIESVVVGMKALLKEQGCDDTYLTGIWKETLPASLLWTPESSANRPTSHRAPSWSWAAVDGGIDYDYERRRQFSNNLLCELVDANCHEEAGLVTNGRLTLRGKLVSGKLSEKPVWWTDLPHLHQIKTETHMSIVELTDPRTDVSLTQGPDDTDGIFNWYVRFDTKKDVEEESLLVPIGTAADRNNGSYDVLGIALKKLDNGLFTRCGTWQIPASSVREAKEIFQDVRSQEIIIT